LASLVAWYDFSDADTLFTDAGSTNVSSDGALIYQANDKSSNGYHLRQGTEAARPAYTTNIQGGLSIARSGVAAAKWLARDGVTLSQPYSAVVVARWPAAADNYPNLWDSNTKYNRFSVARISTSVSFANTTEFFAGTSVYVPISLGTWHIMATNVSGASTAVYVDGGAANTISIGTDTWKLIVLGNRYTLDRSFGDIGEVIICNAGLSTADLNALGGYLATKWGLTWTTVS